MNKPEPPARKVEVVRIGDAAGVILPPDVLKRLQIEIGDSLSFSETPDGVALSAKDPEYERQMTAARNIMTRYRNALNELAK